MSKLYPVIAALGLSVAACSTNLQPGTTPTAFDGTYNGMTSSMNVGAGSCGSMAPAQAKFVVQNGKLVWQAPTGVRYAPIMQDGGFAVADGPVTMLSGKITNTAMVARMNNGSCHVIYDLKRTA